MADDMVATAVLTIRGAGEMTSENRDQIVEWLHRQAFDLSMDGPRYSKQFRARYLQPTRPQAGKKKRRT